MKSAGFLDYLESSTQNSQSTFTLLGSNITLFADHKLYIILPLNDNISP